MTKQGGRRITLSDGAILTDPERVGELAEVAGGAAAAPLSRLFDADFWAQRAELFDVAKGRGSAWFVGASGGSWALRHYRRGGVIANLSKDRYLWAGEARVRAFAEWRLLSVLAERGLPVPRPVAARYRRRGFFYRCDLITERIRGADALSSSLAARPLDAATWRAVGAAVARLHEAGVDHADLNAHNILLDAAGGVSIIDFDRGRLRRPGAWVAGNVARLRRSLDKIARGLPPGRFSEALWALFLAGYSGHPCASSTAS